MSETHDYFTGLADVYDAHRPSYPIEAIDAALDGLSRPLRIADIGCGTGISTRLLAARGGILVQVIGIDPNAEMLQQARRAANDKPSQVEYTVGTAERTGLDDQSCDLVVCAQAFHWFEPVAALREFNRILKNQGRLALIWNVRDDGHDAFTTAYSDIARRSQADARAHGFDTHELRSGDPTVGGYFCDAQVRAFPNPHRQSLDGLLGRARSASYFPRPGNPLRTQLEEQLRALFHQHQREGEVTLHHRTEFTLATRNDAQPM